MPVTREDLESFHRFAEQKLAGGAADSIEQLAHDWQSARKHGDVHEALREAADDLEAGRYRPAADVSRDIRQRYRLPSA